MARNREEIVRSDGIQLSRKRNRTAMKLIWFCIEQPYPPNSGGRAVVFNRIKRISHNNEVFLFFPFDGISCESCQVEMSRYCSEVYSYQRRIDSLWQMISILSKPYTVVSRIRPQMVADVKRLLCRTNIDAVIFEFPHLSFLLEAIPELSALPVFFHLHNIEWKLYQQIANAKSSPLERAAYYFDSIRMKSIEKALAKNNAIRGLSFVSTLDLDYYEAYHGVSPGKLFYSPIGGEAHSIGCSKQLQNTIVFVGSMNYEPNSEAVLWFCTRVFPLILREIPDARCYIVGKSPNDEIRQLTSSNVVVTGEVSTIADYYEMGTLVIVPLLSGGGVKVKLIEAASYGKAIVSTKKGVEGTTFSEKTGVIVCDSEQEFSASCVRLLMNDTARKECEKKIKQHFVDHYLWDSICKEYENWLGGHI